MRFINLILFLFLLHYQHNIYIIVNSNIILYIITFFLKNIKRTLIILYQKTFFLGDYLTDKIIVIHSDGKIELFKPRLIGQAIMKETGVSEKLAMKIQKRIANKFYKLKEDGLNEVSTSQIRAEVSSQLLKEREFEAEEQTRKLGMSVGEFEDLLNNGCKDNANIGYSPEMIAKYAYDSIAKEYALLKMPEECAEAYKAGLMHIHDMEYYMTRPNCMNYDLRFFAKNGLKIDGRGLMGSVSKPAKSLEVLLNHMLQAWMAGATVFSGGQGYVNFNTLLSPFCRGRSYKDIKQAIQGFIFNCNESLICRGGQVLFSSIALDLSCPDVLKDEPAISFEGIAVGTYKDYQDEADLIFKAVCEVSDEKDGQGAYHRFPNILFNIRKGDLDEYKGTCKILHETGANNPTIYYNNCIDMERSTMGCRTSLPMNYTGIYEKDCVNTGNFMYNTINLPLLALEAGGDIEKFYKKLDEICEICYTSLIHRRNTVIDAVYNKHMSDFLLQKDKETGEPLWDIDRTTITLGYCGLNECLQVLYGEGGVVEYEDEGVEIIEFINKKKQEFYERDGLRWSVIASPAESTSFKFGEINRAKYPNCPVRGKEGAYYLTNSHHIPVDSGVDWVRHIQNAGKFSQLSLGGAILHIWSSEVWSDAEAIWKLNKKILSLGNPIFWAFSKVFTYCTECGFTINGKIDVCPICQSKNLRHFDRITGYYLCVDTFNHGKHQEFEDRYRHKITEKKIN